MSSILNIPQTHQGFILLNNYCVYDKNEIGVGELITKGDNSIYNINIYYLYTNLCTSQYRILAGIIRMVFGRDLEYSWHGRVVRVNHVTNEFCHILVDQDDVNVIASQEPLETLLDLAHWCVWYLTKCKINVDN